MLSLKDIAPAAENNINTQFIVLDKGRITFEGRHKTCLALVADETAAVHFQFWGDECEAFQPGDIIRLANGIFSYSRNNLLLRAGRRGKVQKAGEFTLAFVETPNMSEIRWVPDPNNSTKFYLNVYECKSGVLVSELVGNGLAATRRTLRHISSLYSLAILRRA